MNAPLARTQPASTQRLRDCALVRRRSTLSQELSTVEAAVLIVGVGVLAGLATATLLPSGRQWLGLTGRASAALLAASLVYSLGHMVRGLRLAVLLNDPVVGLRRILMVHMLTSGVGLLLPFKLGDLVRMRITGVLVGSATRGVVAVVLERSLDVGVVLTISVVATASSNGAIHLLTPLLIVSAVFVVATIAAVTVVPDYLSSLSLYLVRRPAVPGGVRLIAGLERILVVLDEAPRLLRRRTPTLVVLTGLVWLAELVALGLAVPVLAHDLVRLSSALASFLSSLSSGSVALLPGSLERALATPPLLEQLSDIQLQAYRTVLVVPLLWASACAGVLVRRVILRRGWPGRRKPAW